MTIISSHYKDERGRRYAALVQNDPCSLGYALNLEFFRPYIKQTDHVLDFGCGNGGMLRLLSRYVAKAEGLEVNAASAEMARAAGLNVYAGVDELPREAAYDIVVSNHVLEHVPDVCATLERLRQCIKPGGLFVTKLPIDDFRSSHQSRWSRENLDHHLHTWSPRLFANVLFEAGYGVRECRVSTSAWHPRLFPLVRLGVASVAFRLFAILARRRQLMAVGEVPDQALGVGLWAEESHTGSTSSTAAEIPRAREFSEIASSA